MVSGLSRNLLVVALGLASVAAQEPPRRPRPPTELSDLLTHSSLTPCRGTDGQPAAAERRLRVATWNIKAGRSSSLEEISAEMKAMNADVIALQEVDVNVRRTGFVDQPAMMAASLAFNYAFAASIRYDQGDYGLAVLSRWPLTDVKRHRIEGTEAAEPRIVLETVVCAAGRPLRLFNHHADGRPAAREASFVALRRILDGARGSAAVVAGDLNDLPDSAGVRALIDAGFVDLAGEHGAPTVDTRRIDYLLAAPGLARAAAPATLWITDKSDHYAVMADLTW